jgi:hypothetical protein
MFLNDQILGFIVFFCAYVISRVINENNLKKLNSEEKARLIDAFSNYRIYSLVTVVVVVIVFFIGNSAFPQFNFILTAAFFAVLLLTTIVNSIFIHKKLSSLNLPAGYIKTYWLSSLLQYFGVIFLFATILSRYFL